MFNLRGHFVHVTDFWQSWVPATTQVFAEGNRDLSSELHEP